MTALRVTFGVDPGLSGAIVTLLDGEPGPILDMPTFDNGTANEVDAFAISQFVRVARSMNPGAHISVCIEKVRAMPSTGPNRRTMGAQSSFNFGDGFGQVKAAFRVLGIQPVLVESRSWKTHMGLIGTDKDAARLLAIKRFPSAADKLQRKKDSGRADAMLIALWHENTQLHGSVAA